MGETGNKEVTAADKLFSVLRLSKGGKLIKDDKQKSGLKKNHYFLTFEKLFGIHSKKVILLHKLLTLP